MQVLKTGKIKEYNVLGFTTWSETEVINFLKTGGSPAKIPGDFVIIINGENAGQPFTMLVSSILAAYPYFYHTDRNGKLFHGESVFDVYRQANLKWQWNERALFCFNSFDHLVGTDTIHGQIFRVPNAAILLCEGGKTGLKKFDLEMPEGHMGLDEGIAAYKKLAEEYFSAGKNVFVSLSAGMDSRLLLATCLASGIKPFTATMGTDRSTDVKVAGNIAREFGLQHQQVSLQVSDYMDEKNKRKIVYTTSGTKSLNHWHTYIYINKTGYPDDLFHFAGSNGELARSYYLDKGIFSKGLQGVDAGVFSLYFRLKLEKKRSNLVDYFKKRDHNAEVRKLIEKVAPGSNAMDRFDDFYCTQRVRHFIGNGVALYNTKYKTLSPFLDYRFVHMAKALSRKHKLNSVFHKKAIETLYPSLLRFPNAENNASIADYNTNSYFLKKAITVNYSIEKDLLASAPFQESVVEDSTLDEWTTKEERVSLFENRKIQQIAFLATMAETRKLINEIDGIKARSPEAAISV